MNNTINDNEIEITEVSRSVISFIKKSSKHIVYSFAVGLIIGLLVYSVSPPYYKSQIGLFSENLSDSKLYSLMSDLEIFVRTDEYSTLANKLHISEESAKKISDMKVAGIEQFQETEKAENGIIVTFTVQDNNVFDSLEVGIKYYVENTDYVRSRLASYKAGLISNINSLTKEIKDLDSLKTNLNSMLKKGGKSNLFLADVGYAGSKIVELSEKKNSLQSQLGLISDVRVFKNFSKYHRKAGPRLFVTLLIYIGIAEIMGILFFLMPQIRQFIKNA